MELNQTSIGIMAGRNEYSNDYSHVQHLNVIIYPYPNFIGGFVKPLLKLESGCVITSHINECHLYHLYLE